MIPLSDPDLRRSGRPYVTMALIIANVLVFLYELTLDSGQRTAFFYQWGMIPLELTSGVDYDILSTITGPLDIASPWPAWGTLFSSMFIHGGFMHAASNMLYLWVFGDNVEDRLGHFKFLIFYLATGLAASGAHVATNMDSQIPTIGASGAIAGVLGAYILLYPRSRIRTLVMFVFITILRVPAVFLLGFWFLLQVFSGVGSLGTTALSGGVAYWAHVGGFAAGALGIFLYLRVTGQPIRPPTWRSTEM